MAEKLVVMLTVNPEHGYDPDVAYERALERAEEMSSVPVMDFHFVERKSSEEVPSLGRAGVDVLIYEGYGIKKEEEEE